MDHVRCTQRLFESVSKRMNLSGRRSCLQHSRPSAKKKTRGRPLEGQTEILPGNSIIFNHKIPFFVCLLNPKRSHEKNAAQTTPVWWFFLSLVRHRRAQALASEHLCIKEGVKTAFRSCLSGDDSLSGSCCVSLVSLVSFPVSRLYLISPHLAPLAVNHPSSESTQRLLRSLLLRFRSHPEITFEPCKHPYMLVFFF